MLKRNAKTKVEFFDDTGEIQVVPIDTVVGDGGSDLGVNPDSRKKQVQAIGIRGKSMHHSSFCDD